jgi:hypothetical protein
VHEPKHVTSNGTGASGQVITNSSSSGGTSEYRRLKQSDVVEVDQIISMLEINSTTIQTHYFVMPFSGTVETWSVVVSEALTTANNIWEVQIDGVQVTGTPLTIAFGGAAGDNATQAATADNSFAAGDNVMVVGTTIGNADASVDSRFIITVRRS